MVPSGERAGRGPVAAQRQETATSRGPGRSTFASARSVWPSPRNPFDSMAASAQRMVFMVRHDDVLDLENGKRTVSPAAAARPAAGGAHA